MEKLIARSPTEMKYDTKEGAYQDLEEAHGASAIDPTHGGYHKKVYRMK